jgi:hypothetical protein
MNPASILSLRVGNIKSLLEINRYHTPPNARINPPPDDNTQVTSQGARLMRGTLRAVGLNGMLGGGGTV